jgi:RNA polymerase sigma-70 factor (ECF subfamily)
MSSVLPSRDPGQFAAEVFERHRAALRRYVRSATGSGDLAEELTQEVFLRVVRSGASYEPRGTERAWLFSIARNLVVDHFRRRTDERPSLVDVAQPAMQMLRYSIAEAIGRLPESEREVFLLCEVAGLSYAEIAEATGSSVPAVRSALYRARMTLRALVVPPPAITRTVVSQGDRDDD